MRRNRMVEGWKAEYETGSFYGQRHVCEVEHGLYRIELLCGAWQALDEGREARNSQGLRRAHLSGGQQDER